MEKERIIDCQKKISMIHIVVVLLTMMLIHILGKQSQYVVLSLFCICIAIFEAIMCLRSFFESIPLVRTLRYFDVLCISYILIFKSSFHVERYCYLLYFLVLFELILCMNVSDKYHQHLTLVFAILPATLLLIYKMIRYDQDLIAIQDLMCIGVIYCLLISLIQFYMDVKKQLSDKCRLQLQYIEKANALNLELIENQEKLKKANEQLANQKLQLESANKRIYNVNSEILLQNQVLKLIPSQHDVVRIMSLIVATIRSQMNVDTFAIIIYPNAVSIKKLIYQMRTSYGFKYQQFLGEKIEAGCFDPYIQKKETYVDNQVEAKKYEFVKNGEVESLMIIPLIKADEIIGGLYITDSKKDAFDDNIPFFEAAVSSIIIALENSNLYAKLEEMAIKDELTGIYNRRYLNQIFEQFVFESLRNKTPLSVALFDIDRFKRFNDSYGHLFGDEALKFIANMATEIATEVNGVAGRYGGEEFVVIFPNRNLQDTYEVVKRFHDSIKIAPFYHEEKQVKIGLSVGISSFPETCMNPNDLMNYADWAMYYSKENGRDRITIDSSNIRSQVRLK